MADCDGPDRCVDDLCRGQEVGLCGMPGSEALHAMGMTCDLPWCDECEEETDG